MGSRDPEETKAKQQAAEKNGYKFILINGKEYRTIEKEVKNYGFELSKLKKDARKYQMNGDVLVVNSLDLKGYLKISDIKQ